MERRREDTASADVARVATILAAVAAIAALLGLAIVFIGRPGLLVGIDVKLNIRAMTGVGCLGISLALLGWRGAVPIGGAVQTAALSIAAIAGATSAVNVFGTVHDRVGTLVGHGGLYRHGTSLLSGTCLILLAIAVFGLRRSWPIVVTDTLAGSSCGISLIVLFSWGIGRPSATVLGHEDPPLFVGAVVLAMLAMAVILAEPARGGLGALFASRGAGGVALRRFLPIALIVPLGLEIARHRLASAGVVDVDLARTGQVFVTAAILMLGALACAVNLERSERRLRVAREALFMSTLSHELRTPLIAIRNLADVMNRSWQGVSDEQKRDVNRATFEQATRLLELIHDSSQLRRLDAGTLTGEPQGVELREAMRAAVDERGMRVGVSCPVGLRAWVDPEHLRLMLGASLRLAQRSGPGEVEMRAVAKGDDACVLVEVPSIIRRDVQPDATGWSLWTIAQLARRCGGDASFERIDDQRSRFVVTLPLATSIPGQ